jgi:predicted metal-dependent hydrolase
MSVRRTIHDLDRLLVGDLAFVVAPPTDRTTLQITVERDATLVLRAPSDVTCERAQRFVESKRSWIYRKLAEKDALVGPPVIKQFVDGEGFAYLGRNHRLLVDDAETSVRLDRGRFRIPTTSIADGPAEMRRWYTRTGQSWLMQRSKPWQHRLGIDDVEIVVLDLGHRWGSARGTAKINIHWATLQLPPSLIDYVIAHELTHLVEQNHTPEFWSRLAVVMPDYSERRSALRHVGRNVWLGE